MEEAWFQAAAAMGLGEPPPRPGLLFRSCASTSTPHGGFFPLMIHVHLAFFSACITCNLSRAELS
uniref:Uncharacterized protein n=1 Tax=Triticum urartu TaxID=4572 RepID=A0A8R7VAN1_TRIUA